MKQFLLAALPIISVSVAALLAFIFSRRNAAAQHKRELSSKAYLDLMKGMAEIAAAQKAGDRQAEQSGTALMTEAKARICLYGSAEVVSAFAEFERAGAILDRPDRMARLVEVLFQIRNQDKGSMPAFADVSQLLFGCELTRDGRFMGSSRDEITEVTTNATDLEPNDEKERSYSMNNFQDMDNEIDSFIKGFRESLRHNYRELVKNGNPPGQNTLQIAIVAYMARSLSSLPPSAIEKLKKDGVLDI